MTKSPYHKKNIDGDLLVKLIEVEGRSYRSVADEFGISTGTIAYHVKKHREAEAVDLAMASELTAFEEWEKWDDEKPDWREIVLHAREGADLMERHEPKYDFVKRKIKTDRPIALVFISDLHLGASSTDYDAFLETADFLRNEKDFYFVAVGLDPEMAINHFRSSVAVHDQVLPPVLQIEAQKQWLEWLLDKLVAGCWDNHLDERVENAIGLFSGLGWPKKAPYFHGKGLLELTVGKAVYEIAMSHRHKGSSIYHDFQPVFRLFREFYPADICVTGHRHKPGYTEMAAYPEMRRLMGKPLLNHFILTGTFKTGHDHYSERNFKGRGILGLPTVVLEPDKHDITYFRSPSKAKKYLSS